MKLSQGAFFGKIDKRVDSTVSGWARYIDNGSFFKDPISVIYKLIAIVTMVFPLYLVLKAYGTGFLTAETESKLLILAAILIILAIPVCWVSGSIWWYRSRELDNIVKGNSFLIATPIFAHLLRTAGESYGLLFAVLGCIVNIFLAIFEVDMYLFGFLDYGTKGVLICPVVGYLIIIATRFMSEIVQAIYEMLADKISAPETNESAKQTVVVEEGAEPTEITADGEKKSGANVSQLTRRVLNLKNLAIVLLIIICAITAVLLLSGHERESATHKTEEELLIEQATKDSKQYDFSSEEAEINDAPAEKEAE